MNKKMLRVAAVVAGPATDAGQRLIHGMKKLFGDKFKVIRNVNELRSVIHDAHIIYADNCFESGNKQHEAILKKLLGEDPILVEYKGEDPTWAEPPTILMISCGDDWEHPAGMDENFMILPEWA